MPLASFAYQLQHRRLLVQTERHLCSLQGDEARHEAAYQRVVRELLQRDPDGAMLAFASMMQASIVMPAHLMEAGNLEGLSGAGSIALDEHRETRFFKLFSALTDSMGIYTVLDYAQLMAQLMKRWKIRDISVCLHILPHFSRSFACFRVQPLQAMLFIQHCSLIHAFMFQ
jgi:acyl-[acyl-carrier-protein] desaturase